jgi:hypothetical protein
MHLLKAGNPGKFVQAEVSENVDSAARKSGSGLGFRFEPSESLTLPFLATRQGSDNGFNYE